MKKIFRPMNRGMYHCVFTSLNVRRHYIKNVSTEICLCLLDPHLKNFTRFCTISRFWKHRKTSIQAHRPATNYTGRIRIKIKFAWVLLVWTSSTLTSTTSVRRFGRWNMQTDTTYHNLSFQAPQAVFNKMKWEDLFLLPIHSPDFDEI